MQIKLTTWNINSVRLRIDLVARFLKSVRPDVLCLQETKCPDDAFPRKRFKRLGYEHIALNGQKGYHGVAVVSRLPLDSQSLKSYCGKVDCRHVGVTLGEKAKLRDPVTIHNYYVPAGGDEPDPKINPKFEHKLAFLDELRACANMLPGRNERSIAVGDLNVAPLEHDVWSHKQLLKIVSHTPVEVELFGRLQASLDWIDVPRRFVPSDQKLYSWWSYRNNDWRASNRGRRLDHILATPALSGAISGHRIDVDLRDWAKASDHVPVQATFEI